MSDLDARKVDSRAFVGRIPEACSQEDLVQHFSVFGCIDVSVPPHKQGRQQIAYVTFDSPDALQCALADKHILAGSELNVQRAEPRMKDLKASAGGGCAGGAALMPVDSDTLAQRAVDSRLFIGRIPRNVSELDLKNYFASYGLIDLDVPPNQAGQTYIAYATFIDPVSCAAVMDVPHFIGGHQMNVQVAEPRKKPKATPSVEATVSAVTTQALFPSKGFGKSPWKGPYGPSGTWPFVSSSPYSSMPAARGKGSHEMLPLAGTIGPGRKFPMPGQPTPPNKRIFVGQIPCDISDEELGAYFSQFGEVAHLEWPRHKQVGKPKQYCYVTFQDVSQSSAAVEASHTIHGARLNVTFAAMKDVELLQRLFVGQIPVSYDEAAVTAYFQQFGEVQSCEIKPFKPNASKGIGFVTMVGKAAIQAALAAQHWIDESNQLNVQVAEARRDGADSSAQMMAFSRGWGQGWPY